MKHFKNEYIAHAGVLVFSFATILNVKEYLIYTNHPPEFSWVLATALGIVLVSMSFMLSKSNRESPAFKLKLGSTIAICVLSGTMQMLNYYNHGLHWATSALFGYGFPIVAEMLLAMSVSLHEKEMREKAAAQTEDTIKLRISESIAQSFERIDVSNNSAYIESRIQEVVKAQTDSIIQQMMPKTVLSISERFNQIIDDTENDEDFKKVVPLKDDEILKAEDFKKTANLKNVEPEILNSDIGNSKTPFKSDAYTNFLNLMKERYNEDVESIHKPSLATELNVSLPTVYSYIKRYNNAQKC